MQVQMVCSECGSDNVSRDAWAEWDPVTQSWGLAGYVFDDAYCHNCEGSTTLNEEEYDGGTSL